MTYNDEDIIYVFTKTDVEDVAKEIGIRNLTDEHYRKAEKYLTSLCSDGAYTWTDAIADALKDAERELQDRHSKPVPGK